MFNLPIEETAHYLLKDIYEQQNSVNLYGILPLNRDSKQFKKAKKTALLYCQNRANTELYNYIKENY